jgi:carboxymethylenebutenolidase
MKLRYLALALLVTLFPLTALAQEPSDLEVEGTDLDVMSGGQAYRSYLAAPTAGGPYPGIVLIHSFNGLEEGYRTLTDRLAAQGFVVLAAGWQTFERGPSDATVGQLVTDSVALLTARDDVDPARLGLTGFCAGGRYTMLFLPQMDVFAAGVAWYGFPYNGDPAPASFIDALAAPLLILHGTEDRPSPIADIYRYAGELAEAGKYFEMKIYQGEPHGFMLANGQMRQDDVAADAFDQMVRFFQRKL